MAVADALTPTCDTTFASMVPGEVQTYTCDATAVTADFTNTAIVSADGGLTAFATADVTVTLNPAISITKDADQTINVGDTATFTILVENTGDVDLTNVVVADPLTPTCDNTFATLAVGATQAYVCQQTNVLATYTNEATVLAQAPDTSIITDVDQAVVTVNAPAITLTKDADQTIVSGADANFTITLENTGNVTLTNVVVTDALTPSCDNTFAQILTGGIETYTCQQTNVTASYTNSATVTTTEGASATDTAQVTVAAAAPAITLTKDADQTIASGADANFTITLENTGNVDLTTVVVTDALSAACDNTFATIPVGGIETYTCVEPAVTADFTNSADVTTAEGATATDTAQVTVVPAVPDIVITKQFDQTISSGGTTIFSITLENVGNVDLTNVVVTDPLVPACDNTFATLAVGGIETYTCQQANVTADYTNTATVTTAEGATDSDSSQVTVTASVPAPSISLLTTPSAMTVASGSDVTFFVTVHNNGNADLANVVISDAAGACDNTFATLAVGEVQVYSCTLNNVTASINHVINVTADDTVNGGTLNAGATLAITVPNSNPNPTPAATTGTQAYVASDPFITKNASPPFAIPGELVTFTFFISNPGTGPALNVRAVDPIPSEVEILGTSSPSGQVSVVGQDVIFETSVLAPGETVTVTIETRVRDNVATPFIIVNEACFTGDNIPDERCDTATVLSITTLPDTGETPWWSILLRQVTLLIGGGVLLMGGTGVIIRRVRG